MMSTKSSGDSFQSSSSPRLQPVTHMDFTDNSSYHLEIKSAGIEIMKAAIEEKLCEGEDAVRQVADETFATIARAAGNALRICTQNAVNSCPLGSTNEDFANRIIANISCIENEYYQLTMTAPAASIEVTYESNEAQEDLESLMMLGYNGDDSSELGMDMGFETEEELSETFGSQPLLLQALEVERKARKTLDDASNQNHDALDILSIMREAQNNNGDTMSQPVQEAYKLVQEANSFINTAREKGLIASEAVEAGRKYFESGGGFWRRLLSFFGFGLPQEKFEEALSAAKEAETAASGALDAAKKAYDKAYEAFLEDGDTELSNPSLDPNLLSFSSEGARLMSEIEQPSQKGYYKYDSQGNITHIKNHDVGETSTKGITIGFGIFVPLNDTAKQKMLKEKYNVDAKSLDEWVDIATATKIYSDSIAEYENKVKTWASENNYTLKQNEFDALVMQAFNGWKSKIAQAYMSHDKSDEEVVQAVLDVYRTYRDWNKYGAGWENRVRAQLSVFRYSDYSKKY